MRYSDPGILALNAKNIYRMLTYGLNLHNIKYIRKNCKQKCVLSIVNGTKRLNLHKISK